jgi:hypothetical protein
MKEESIPCGGGGAARCSVHVFTLHLEGVIWAWRYISPSFLMGGKNKGAAVTPGVRDGWMDG